MTQAVRDRSRIEWVRIVFGVLKRGIDLRATLCETGIAEIGNRGGFADPLHGQGERLRRTGGGRGSILRT